MSTRKAMYRGPGIGYWEKKMKKPPVWGGLRKYHGEGSGFRVLRRSNHYCLQLNPVRCCPNKFLPAMTGERHFFDIEKACCNQDINILLDCASIAMQTICDCSYGGWI